MAIKGCSKQMIVLSGGAGDVFESASFIVKNDLSSRPRSYGELLREANRIVEENTFSHTKKKNITSTKLRVFIFLAGLLCGAALVGLVWMLFALASL